MLLGSLEIWQQRRRRASQSARLCGAAENRTERSTRPLTTGIYRFLFPSSLRLFQTTLTDYCHFSFFYCPKPGLSFVFRVGLLFIWQLT